MPIIVQDRHEQCEQEFAFAQYFDVLGGTTGIDSALGCVKLRWSRNESRRLSSGNGVLPGKWFASTPTSSSVGSVLVIPCIDFCSLRALRNIMDRGEILCEQVELFLALHTVFCSWHGLLFIANANEMCHIDLSGISYPQHAYLHIMFTQHNHM